MTFPKHLRGGVAIGALVLFAIVANTASGRAADIANGRKIAAAKCQMCHGMDGQGKVPAAPHLSGQVEPYLVTQMKAFHDGVRKNEMMSLVVPTLSESDVADVAAYYAAIEVTIGKVPGE